MKNRNYRIELEQLVKGLETVPTLLLHACCAPCSSAVLEMLAEHFDITVFYYNPKITDEAEYRKRSLELQKLLREMRLSNPPRFLEGPYDPERFLRAAEGLEDQPEGGERCRQCFSLRLSKTGETAKAKGFDYFTTTLTISPMKNAALLNEIGESVSAECGVPFLPSDFKKNNGYLRSIELSKQYDLYRQDYCGCEYSKRERDERKKQIPDLC